MFCNQVINTTMIITMMIIIIVIYNIIILLMILMVIPHDSYRGTYGKDNLLVRFQVLTAGSMMFRIVFWDVQYIPEDNSEQFTYT
jgi:hypothetical protein